MTLKKKLRTSKKKKINSGIKDSKNTVLRSQSNRGINLTIIINYTKTIKKTQVQKYPLITPLRINLMSFFFTFRWKYVMNPQMIIYKEGINNMKKNKMIKII